MFWQVKTCLQFQQSPTRSLCQCQRRQQFVLFLPAWRNRCLCKLGRWCNSNLQLVLRKCCTLMWGFETDNEHIWKLWKECILLSLQVNIVCSRCLIKIKCCQSSCQCCMELKTSARWSWEKWFYHLFSLVFLQECKLPPGLWGADDLCCLDFPKSWITSCCLKCEGQCGCVSDAIAQINVDWKISSGQ